MDDWQKMIRSRARYGSFIGRGRADEDAYYAFLDRAETRSRLFSRIASGAFVLMRGFKARCALLAASRGAKPSP